MTYYVVSILEWNCWWWNELCKPATSRVIYFGTSLLLSAYAIHLFLLFQAGFCIISTIV